MGNACTGCFDKNKSQDVSDEIKQKFVDKTKKEKLLSIDVNMSTQQSGNTEEPDTYRGHPKDIKFISGTTSEADIES